MNAIDDYYRAVADEQRALIGALCFARGYTRHAAESIRDLWDELSTTSRGRAELRARLDRLITALRVPADELVVWEQNKTADGSTEVNHE